MNKNNFPLMIIYGLAGAVAYCIPATIFISDSDKYSGFYLLYVGNFIFFLIASIAVLHFGRQSQPATSLGIILRFGVRVTAITALLSCLYAVIFYFAAGRNLHLAQAPPSMEANKNNGLWSGVFLTASMVNLFIGFFASLITGVIVKQGMSTKNF
jgi:hypothetical protein